MLQSSHGATEVAAGQRLANRAKIRRWLRICKRLVYLYKHIHIYRQ